MTGVDRDALVARAKQLAVPVANCTAAGIPPSHLIGDASWHELFALVLVLADAADPARLRAVCAARDGGGTPEGEWERLRRAHAKAEAMRRAGIPRPLTLRAADGQYRARLRAARKLAVAVPPGRRAAA